jgi:hypothetical protein
MASPTTTTTYTVTALNTATGCAKSDAVVVTVNPLPTANAGLDKTLCAGGSTTIGTTGTSGFTYTWSPTTGLSSAFVAIPTATPSATTTYTLTVKNSTSLCTKTDAVLVTVNPLPGANAGTDKTIVSGSSVIIGTTAVAGRSYNWSPATALSSPTSAQPAASPLQTTNYTLTVTMVATGCTSTDQVVVNVTSPNEGGITDGTDEVVKEMQSSLGFKVFPNPVSNVLNITSEMAMRSHVKVMMYNQVGQLIHEQIVNLDNQSLDVQLPTSELAHGIYTIQISTAQTLETYKVVKE